MAGFPLNKFGQVGGLHVLPCNGYFAVRGEVLICFRKMFVAKKLGCGKRGGMCGLEDEVFRGIDE